MWLSPETRTVVLLTLVIYFRYMHLRDLAKIKRLAAMNIFTVKSCVIWINMTHGGYGGLTGELCLIHMALAAEGICPMIIVPTWEWIACSFSLSRPSPGCCWVGSSAPCWSSRTTHWRRIGRRCSTSQPCSTSSSSWEDARFALAFDGLWWCWCQGEAFEASFGQLPVSETYVSMEKRVL